MHMSNRITENIGTLTFNMHFKCLDLLQTAKSNYNQNFNFDINVGPGLTYRLGSKVSPGVEVLFMESINHALVELMVGS